MNTEPIKHATFSVERTYPADAARVFRAFSDTDVKRRWFGLVPVHRDRIVGERRDDGERARLVDLGLDIREPHAGSADDHRHVTRTGPGRREVLRDAWG